MFRQYCLRNGILNYLYRKNTRSGRLKTPDSTNLLTKENSYCSTVKQGNLKIRVGVRPTQLEKSPSILEFLSKYFIKAHIFSKLKNFQFVKKGNPCKSFKK